MGFSPCKASLASVIAIAALFGARATAESIPGPPIASSTREVAGAFCPAPGSAGGQAAGFAAGVAIVAIAARRRASFAQRASGERSPSVGRA
jgi:hypothetical protein